FARFHEYFAGRDELHAVRTEIAEAQAQTAPRAERPDGPPAGQAKGLDLARAGAAVRIAVFKLQHASRPDRFVQRVDHAGFRLVPALRHEHALTFGASAQLGRKHGVDLQHRRLRAPGQALPGESADEARAYHQRFQS